MNTFILNENNKIDCYLYEKLSNPKQVVETNQPKNYKQ